MTPPNDGLTPEEVRIQRILKVVVAVLGIAILVVLGIIMMRIVGGTGKDKAAEAVADDAAEPDVPVVSTPAQLTIFGERKLTLPAGSEILETVAGNGIIVLRARSSNGEQLVIVDAANGVERGRIVLDGVK